MGVASGTEIFLGKLASMLLLLSDWMAGMWHVVCGEFID